MTTRPTSLREVAEQSESVTDFGFNVREWLHEIRRFSSRPQLQASIADEPRRLRGRFPEGETADAWLAAYAEHLATAIHSVPPAWALQEGRVAEEPWVSDEMSTPKLRALSIAGSPLAFKRRNLFTPDVWLPLRLHPGRPRKSPSHKLKTNAERQRRFRARRKAELVMLREFFAGPGRPATAT